MNTSAGENNHEQQLAGQYCCTFFYVFSCYCCSCLKKHHALLGTPDKSKQKPFVVPRSVFLKHMQTTNNYPTRIFLLLLCPGGCEVLCLSVCLSVRLHNAEVKNHTAELHQILCMVPGLWPGSVILWWRCDMLCTSGFVNYVKYSQNGSLVRDLYSKAVIEHE